MGRILGILVLLLAVISTIFVIGNYWPPPAPVTEMGRAIDVQFTRTMVVVGIAFILAQVGLGYLILRYGGGRKGEKALYTHGNNRLEVVWTLLTAVVFVILGVMAQQVWAQLHLADTPAGALEYEVVGQQFLWNIRNPGPDGKFGASRPELYNDQTNPVGIDENDPAGKDDVVSSIMVLPVNRPVRLRLRSKDVIHNFFVPQFRIKQDAVPGLETAIYVQPEQVGEYEVVCAELCGMTHYRMKSFVRVVSEQEYQKWLQDQIANK